MNASIAFAFKSCAILTAAFDIACGERSYLSFISKSRFERQKLQSSTLVAIFLIIFTASTGCLPIAVSPDNIIASVPSRIAFATSLASALVGIGFSIIDSSICVATIQTFLSRIVWSTMYFCTIGTSSGDISMPKSPLATIIPSVTFKISSRFSTA